MIVKYKYIYMYLVGGIATPLKNMSSSNGIIVPNWMDSHKISWFQTTKQFSSMIFSTSFLSIQSFKCIYSTSRTGDSTSHLFLIGRLRVNFKNTFLI